MSLIGKMINIKSLLGLFSLLLISSNIFASDFGQALSGQDIENNFDDKYKDVTDNSVFVPGKSPDLIYKSDQAPSPFMGDFTQQPMEKKLDKNALDVGITPPGTFSDSSNYLEHDMKILLHDIEMKGKKALSLNYFKDTFEYVSKNDVFDKVYRENSKSHNIGTFQMAYNYFLFKRAHFENYLGANIGVGYNEGPGVFIYSREVSDTTFHLASFPADLSFGFGLRPGKWMKLGLEGGPSAMGLYQTRSDRGSSEKGKRRRQVGFGYYGQGALKISLSDLFPRYYHRLYYGMNITKVWLNILARYHNYSNFQDDIQISGLSLGIGFAFESF